MQLQRKIRYMQLASHGKQNMYRYQDGSSKGGFYTGIGNLYFHRAEMRHAPYIKYSYTVLWNEEQIFSSANIVEVQGYFPTLRMHSYIIANMLRNTSEMVETHQKHQSVGYVRLYFYTGA